MDSSDPVHAHAGTLGQPQLPIMTSTYVLDIPIHSWARSSSSSGATRRGDGGSANEAPDHALLVHADRPLLEQATKGALERLLADAEEVADLLW